MNPESWKGMVLVYADGRRRRIVNVTLKINGVSGGVVMLPIGEKAWGPQDIFSTVEEISKWVNLGVWKLEAGL